MRVLIACEFSGAVRDAFIARGHDAWSCDLLPAEGETNRHIHGDVESRLYDGWDMMIAHPPCTHLSVSGARWFKEKETEQAAALDFVRLLLDSPIPRIALENPISVISTKIRKPNQVIQPWQFGHEETKATCLWLKGLPPLVPTHRDKPDLFAEPAPEGRENRVWRMSPGPDRWKERSRTFSGIANAMAEQWGGKC